MFEIIVFVAVVQIFLSVNLILRRKNNIAAASEIISSTLLLLMVSVFSGDKILISCKDIVIVLGEYLFVKLFLVCFMIIARVYCFYEIKNLCKKRKKINKKELKFLILFNNAKYWPRLKLGVPGKAGKRNLVTKVKFDEKGFPIFKAYYTVKLRRRDFRKTRDQHFSIANKTIYQDILSKARVRDKFTKQEIKKFSQGITPNGYTWHHHQDAGVLQLVEYDVHAKTSHIGGYSIWGGKTAH